MERYTNTVEASSDTIDICRRLVSKLQTAIMTGSEILIKAQNLLEKNPSSKIKQLPGNLSKSIILDKCSYEELKQLENMFGISWPINSDYINWLLKQKRLDEFLSHDISLYNEDTLAYLCKHNFDVLLSFNKPEFLSGQKCTMTALKYRTINECMLMSDIGYFAQKIETYIIGEPFYIIFRRKDISLKEQSELCELLLNNKCVSGLGLYQIICVQKLESALYFIEWAQQFKLEHTGCEYITSFSVHGIKLFDKLKELDIIPRTQYKYLLEIDRPDKIQAIKWFQEYFCKKNFIPDEQIINFVCDLQTDIISLLLECDIELPRQIFGSVLQIDISPEENTIQDFWNMTKLLYDHGYIPPGLYEQNDFKKAYFIYRWLLEQKDYQEYNKKQKYIKWRASHDNSKNQSSKYGLNLNTNLIRANSSYGSSLIKARYSSNSDMDKSSSNSDMDKSSSISDRDISSSNSDRDISSSNSDKISCSSNSDKANYCSNPDKDNSTYFSNTDKANSSYGSNPDRYNSTNKFAYQNRAKTQMCKFDKDCKISVSRCRWLHTIPSRKPDDFPEEMYYIPLRISKNRAQELCHWLKHNSWWGATIQKVKNADKLEHDYQCEYECLPPTCSCGCAKLKFMVVGSYTVDYYCCYKHIPEKDRKNILYCQINI